VGSDVLLLLDHLLSLVRSYADDPDSALTPGDLGRRVSELLALVKEPAAVHAALLRARDALDDGLVSDALMAELLEARRGLSA
jgi:ethanolamine ammonia-lyase small subunit